MTKRTFGLMAGLVSSAVATWYFLRHRAPASSHLTPPRERGTVIFDNTPTAAGVDRY